MTDGAFIVGRDICNIPVICGGIAMAGRTVKSETGCFGMTLKAVGSDTTNPVKVRAMAQGTGRLDISCRVVEGIVRASPVCRVGIIDTVAGFAAVTSGAGDPNVEAWVGPWTTNFTMTGLAGSQIGFGIRPVSRAA